MGDISRGPYISYHSTLEYTGNILVYIDDNTVIYDTFQVEFDRLPNSAFLLSKNTWGWDSWLPPTLESDNFFSNLKEKDDYDVLWLFRLGDFQKEKERASVWVRGSYLNGLRIEGWVHLSLESKNEQIVRLEKELNEKCSY